MCRAKEKICSALGEDKSKWSKTYLIRIPDSFEIAVDSFSRAVSELVKGNRKESLKALSECNSAEIGKFFIEHGQQSAYFRVANWQEVYKENQIKKKQNLSQRNPTQRETRKVFERDFYRCCYCNLRIIPKEVFSEYSRIVGSDKFSVARKNSERNGLTLGLRGVADHVKPYASGGETGLENLVTSCYSCNFGKAGYTLEQLDIKDPRRRPIKNDGWKGLIQFLPALKIIK